MADFKIIMTNDLASSFRTNIGGAGVSFAVRWNELDGHWYMTMDVNGVRVLTGVRMTAGSNMIARQSALSGTMEVRPLREGDESDPGLISWENTHELIYVEP